MGFNKRIIEQELLDAYIEKGKPIKPLYRADALIFMDKLSSKVHEWIEQKITEEELILKIKEYKNENS